MEIEHTSLKDCYIIKPKVFGDDRGYFFESYNRQVFESLTGLKVSFVQDNQSKSSKGVLRGLHFQIGKHEQGKLVRVIQGKVLDVVVDIRPNSKTFGEHYSIILDAIENKQLYVPRGFAHGFLVLEDETIFSYKCDNYYNKEYERGIAFNSKQLNIDWNMSREDIILSKKDKTLPTFETYFK